jgi:hypothetical protein
VHQRTFLMLPAGILLCWTALAQVSNARPGKLEGLGLVSFPVSCSAATQPRFDRAVALLHSFQYATAQSAFAEIARNDPPCAMAFWGQAMSLFQPLFELPDDDVLSKGKELVAQAVKTGAKTDRERAYIQATVVLYQDAPKYEQSARLKAFSSAIAEVYQRYPQDGEAAAFYAFSLLPWYRDDQPQARAKALTILKVLFAKEPGHPGVVHYLIHAADTPELAHEALEAAHRYTEIAPSSAHALHMPSHIFSHLGLWKDSIDSNLASGTAAAEATRKGENQSEYQLHAMHYLLYAYLQIGRDSDAKRLVDGVRDVPGVDEVDTASDGSLMTSIFLMETHQWKEAAQVAPPVHADLFSKMRIHWMRAIAECRLGEADKARTDVANLLDEFSGLRKQNPLASPDNALVLEAEAWLAHAQGKDDEAVSKMRAASRVDEFSIDDESLPAYEMLGDLQLELHRLDAALDAYEASLKEAPNRFNSLWGAGRAAELSNHYDKAMSYYTNLAKVSDPQNTRPAFLAAKAFLAKNKK